MQTWCFLLLINILCHICILHHIGIRQESIISSELTIWTLSFSFTGNSFDFIGYSDAIMTNTIFYQSYFQWKNISGLLQMYTFNRWWVKHMIVILPLQLSWLSECLIHCDTATVVAQLTLPITIQYHTIQLLNVAIAATLPPITKIYF